MQEALILADITCTFPASSSKTLPYTALRGASLRLREGEFVAIVGPTGCGKSTLLNVAAGLLAASQGSVSIFGETLHGLNRHAAYMFQADALLPWLNARDNAGLGLELRGVPKKDAAARAEQWLLRVGLHGHGDKYPHQLSGGMKKRVALAQVLVLEPRILLMDEPLSALDKQLRDRMQIELRFLHDRLGMTTVCVTHDQREALTMSDRVAVIDHGRIRQLDAPRTIYERPANRFVAEFVGESAFLPVEQSGGEFRFAGAALKLLEHPGSGGPWLLMVRPERLHVVTGAPTAETNLLRGRVVALVYQGESVLLQVELADGTRVPVRGSSAQGAMASVPRPGEAVTLGLAPADTFLLPNETLADQGPPP